MASPSAGAAAPHVKPHGAVWFRGEVVETGSGAVTPSAEPANTRHPMPAMAAMLRNLRRVVVREVCTVTASPLSLRGPGRIPGPGDTGGFYARRPALATGVGWTKV